MKIRTASVVDGKTVITSDLSTLEGDWVWADVYDDARSGSGEHLVAHLGLDQLAVADSFRDSDLPKFDDFQDHLLIVLHGLRSDAVKTYEVDCFLMDGRLLTIHRDHSPIMDLLWAALPRRPHLLNHGPDVLLARLADGLTRRLQLVVTTFEEEIGGLIERALVADPELPGDLMSVRTDVVSVRRVIRPQREVLHVLRTDDSPLLSDLGQRHFSDVLDVATRTSDDLDLARAELAETLDIYRGAEARNATEVSRVLTIYAAVMLPLSIVVGFFGMNFEALPGRESTAGLLLVTAGMIIMALASLASFKRLGWLGEPQTEVKGRRGLSRAITAPVKLARSSLSRPHIRRPKTIK